jgi:hypothetical protein
MSEEPESTQAVDTSVDTAVDTSTVPTEAAPAAEETKQEAPAFQYPAKFLKEDGTPDHERLAKSYLAMEKKFSSKPNIPDEYKWEPPENAVELDEEGVSAFKAEALEQGFTSKQYQFLMSRYNDIVVGMRDAAPTAEKTEQMLKAEWGNDFDHHLSSAKAGFEHFAPSDANPNDPVWNHPAVMKLLARIGAEVSEDSAVPKAKAATGGESVQSQIDALRASPDYWKPENQAKVLALYEKLAK